LYFYVASLVARGVLKGYEIEGYYRRVQDAFIFGSDYFGTKLKEEVF
jgi:hypothetical protein